MCLIYLARRTEEENSRRKLIPVLAGKVGRGRRGLDKCDRSYRYCQWTPETWLRFVVQLLLD